MEELAKLLAEKTGKSVSEMEKYILAKLIPLVSLILLLNIA